MKSENSYYKKEACVGSFQQALSAQKAGADQVELCSRLDLDGLTPHHTDIKECLSRLDILTKVMIRPDAGAFITSEDTVQKMLIQIEEAKQFGVQYVVFGLTDQDNHLDIDTLCMLRDKAYPMQITIHKAIDSCMEPVSETQRLVTAGGFDSILTSGGAKTAEEGASIIKEMIQVSGGQLTIIAAGGITNDNIDLIDAVIGGCLYHGKRIVGAL